MSALDWFHRRRARRDVVFEAIPAPPSSSEHRPFAVENIAIDHQRGRVIIDDFVLPFNILAEYDIDTILSGLYSSVSITIPTKNARVLRTLDDDLGHIRAVADDARRDLGLPVPDRRSS
ncbi:hypothetical protein JL108_14425 [Aeromicrobium sp. YIM 150415]|uniref:hypothetical protein n=1 Tax=Aeromicrobium sp. YIM 150415 TaxID=2803912 RepID=UPI001963ACEE|nr:hypothetical protein [Aeromicrobium sp. YIM 150415]MBM9464649.1 hypothetical protein [Aeromicrobium sp. YIM 150415]